MAYCVHCGVKLDDSEKRCPLCGTVVFDPARPEPVRAPRPYPVRTPEQELKRNKRFLLIMASVMLLAPALLCLVIDGMLTGGVTWSGYASGALALLYLCAAVPLLAPRHGVYWAVGAAFIGLNAYLFLVEGLSQSGPWALPIALPALAVAALLIFAVIALYRRGWLNKLTLLAAVFPAAALECVAVEWLLRLSRGISGPFVWSPFVLAPCVFLSLALFFINGNRSVREEVRRRVHF